MRKALVILWLLVMAPMLGCQSQPFERETLTSLGEISDADLLGELAARTPSRLVTDDTVVIEIPFRDDLAIISVARIDRRSHGLQLLGMNHLGVKLFHVAHDGKEPSVVFAAGPLEERKDILLSIAQDTWRIYFDLIPSIKQVVKRSDLKLVARRKTEEGTLRYSVAGHPARLIEKKLSTCWGSRWRISYFDYQPATVAEGETTDQMPPTLHPTGIVLDNSKYHYRIIIHNRKWRELAS